MLGPCGHSPTSGGLSTAEDFSSSTGLGGHHWSLLTLDSQGQPSPSLMSEGTAASQLNSCRAGRKEQAAPEPSLPVSEGRIEWRRKNDSLTGK